MLTEQQILGLRTALDNEPSEEAWNELCQLLKDWHEDEELDEALDYAEQHLTGWEDYRRKSPWYWQKKFLFSRNRA